MNSNVCFTYMKKVLHLEQHWNRTFWICYGSCIQSCLTLTYLFVGFVDISSRLVSCAERIV